MLKNLTILIALAAIFSTTNLAQWDNTGAWPTDDLKGATHGLAVDPDGKVWVTNYYSDESIEDVNSGDTNLVHSIKIFEPDGTPADFSPIKVIELSEFEADTLYGAMTGLRRDHEGNILVTTGADPVMMYRINYETGEGMNSVEIDLENAGTAPAVADNGDIYVSGVFPGNPIFQYSSDFSFLGNAVEESVGFSRAFEVSPDGERIYWAGYSLGYITVYERPDEFSAYDSVDTILEGFAAESFGWHPTTGDLWISAGSGNDPAEGYSNFTWYAYDTDNEAIVDSMKWDLVDGIDPVNQRPRAIDFSPDGNIAYVSCFATNDLPMIQKLEYTVDVEEVDGQMPQNYSLEQNYPNPFNPVTNIRFAIPESGYVTMKIFNTVGEEVTTLVQERKQAGEYSVSFNAENLPSGVYVYQIQVNDFTASKKMMLVK